MTKIAEKPLALNFYNNKEWHKKLLSYYDDEKYSGEKAIYSRPLEFLTRSIANIINIYGNFPNETCLLLKQTIDPLYAENEYFNSIYLRLKETAAKEDNPKIVIMADSLLYIRRVFKKDKAFLKSNFHEEIEAVQGTSFDEKMDKFSDRLKKVTNVHLMKVINAILANK